MRVNECESHTTHTDTNTHRHKHTQTDTHAESRGETHHAPNYTVCVWGGKVISAVSERGNHRHDRQDSKGMGNSSTDRNGLDVSLLVEHAAGRLRPTSQRMQSVGDEWPEGRGGILSEPVQAQLAKEKGLWKAVAALPKKGHKDS